MDHYLSLPNIRLHYLDYPGPDPPLLFLPGLTANARFVAGLVAAGLSEQHHILGVDLRGRGLSDKPETGYRMVDHAQDVVNLLDALEIDQAVVCGHSFGGFIGIVLAATYPKRFPQLVIIDAAVQLINERTRQLIKSSLDRLEQSMPSLDVYMAAMQQMPYLHGFWDESLAAYYRGDVQEFPDGRVRALARPEAVAETIDMQFVEPWADHIAAIQQPVLLINAPGPYGPPGTPAVLPAETGRAAAAEFAQGTYVQVPGNHITMMFGENAGHVVAEILKFVGSTRDE
jgi:pimeloyl-ACP methyl ester carboxylesterase